MNGDDNHTDLHPAELQRRKRQEERRRHRYERVSMLTRQLGSQAGPLTNSFCINSRLSQELNAPVIDRRTVDRNGRVVEDGAGPELTDAEQMMCTLLEDAKTDARQWKLTGDLARSLLPTMCGLSLASIIDDSCRTQPLIWAEDSPWQLTVRVHRDKDVLRLEPLIKRDHQLLPPAPFLLTVPGLAVLPDGTVAFLEVGSTEVFIHLMRGGFDPADLLKRIVEETTIPVVGSDTIGHKRDIEPRLIVSPARYKYRGTEQLHTDIYFRCGDVVYHEDEERDRLFDRNAKSAVMRVHEKEERCKDKLRDLGFRWSVGWKEEKGWKLPPARLPGVVRELLRDGWIVNAEGKTYRPPEEYEVTIRTGHDWFGVKGAVRFGDQLVPIPAILKLWREGSEYLLLDDGSKGLLPVEWLINYTVLTELGRDEDGEVIVSNSQAAILQALLDGKATVQADDGYHQKLEELAQIDSAAPVSAPPSFNGTLRPYQEEALGWLVFLQKQGFGGILALDMGLGKTPTVLALLERQRAHTDRPSIAIVPRSLIFNWQAEAVKFVPQLKLLVWSGPRRRESFGSIPSCDLLLTTYGTLCRDIELLKDTRFDYCILDESQAIKNADTSNAKAVRLVNCDHRIAMTGTPIENSLSELWSQFEFLNPGLLGGAGVFRKFSANRKQHAHGDLCAIAAAVQPFIFRRTKSAVATDLPPKAETVLYCELRGRQRRTYDELLEYYRQELTEAEAGDRQSQAQLLAALLRLRQAACHPGLINDTHRTTPSAKLTVLMENLQEVIAEGHKALVFSQFTTFLGFVGDVLTMQGIEFAYLDGQTKDRAAAVDQFQTDPNCPIFLISLKAGGTGLNLTAASYVYILDPWWNPAVEAQAVDRAYRIGQENPVVAYRLVAKDTVEEKIFAMQAEKRELADAIVGTNTGTVSREEMRGLLR